ncbi:hypothetical protein B0T20DRAFT_454817 [Sordaria brevicollis]|uniref:Uncharacterized protein n=1 Tax=Sordaria brevicollis TaxID=83679 RepID=A0AAE0PA78_SORBR|nr:hypothetical protein B0T20DRAFT_454817 [Sordaria brevicollis]
MHATLITSVVALLPAATPVPPAPSTVTAKPTFPGKHPHHHHHDGALKPRTTSTTSFDPADFWPDLFPPNEWQEFHPGWGEESRPCHASQFYSCADPYVNRDNSCENANPNNGGEFGNWGCLCERAPKFFKCMSQAQNNDPECWRNGYNGDSCNDNRPQCCPWPVATISAKNDPSSTIDVQVEPELEHKDGDAWPRPAKGYKGKLKDCPDDYYSVSGGCCPAGFYFFTAALGGQTPCWRPLSSTAKVPPVTTKGVAEQGAKTNAETSTEPGDIQELSKATSAINNVIFSRHYPVDDPKDLSPAGKIGVSLGIGIPVSAALSALLWFLRRHRRNKKREKLRRAREQADNYRYYTHIWDGPHHGSVEHLLFPGGPGQELQTFNTRRTRNYMMNRTDSVHTTTSSTHEQISHLQQRQNELIAQRMNAANMNNTPGYPPPVHIPPRVSSAAATVNNNNAARYSYGHQLASHNTSGIPLARHSGNAWGAHAFDSNGEKARGEKEADENPFEDMGGAVGSSSSSSTHHNGVQQQRQSGSGGQHSAGHQGMYGLHGEEADEGYLEPPPEYKE